MVHRVLTNQDRAWRMQVSAQATLGRALTKAKR